MEIADYLAAARRRRWLLILVPLISVVAAVAYSLLSPARYTAMTTVISPSLVGTPYSQFSGPQSINQFVSSFSASAADPSVIAQTSEETGASRSELKDNVSVAQVGASSNVTLTYTDPDEERASLVAEALAGNALGNMYSAQVQVADQQVKSAQEALAAANKELSEYLEEIGVGNPSVAYQAALNQVTGLQQTQAAYAATGDSDAARLMKSFVSDAKEQATALGDTLPKYDELLSARTMATTSYESELANQRSIQAQATAAAAPGVIATQGVDSDKSRTATLKLAITVFGASVLMAIMLVALLEFIAAVRRQGTHAADTIEAGTTEAGTDRGNTDQPDEHITTPVTTTPTEEPQEVLRRAHRIPTPS